MCVWCACIYVGVCIGCVYVYMYMRVCCVCVLFHREYNILNYSVDIHTYKIHAIVIVSELRLERLSFDFFAK